VTARAAEAPRPLRIVTFNVLHGGVSSARLGDGDRLEDRLAMSIEQLRALDADVLCLQEASVAGDRGDVAARIASALGYRYVRASSGWRWVGWMAKAFLGFEEGPAILSRFPIDAAETLRLGSCGVSYGRVLLCARLATPWGPLDACSTHTSSSGCHLHSIATLLGERPRDGALVVTGDMNAQAESEGARHLRATLGLVDTFRTANPTADGFTVFQPVRDPARRARRRVDFILAAPAPGATLRVERSEVVLDRPGIGGDGAPLWPSDHYGVLAVVDLFQ
jgi:endonuclease/exonuclease/phosphatase family metal-dependent hydrolase